jgi:transcriptional regulator with XRE-family HTH domain
VIKLTFGERLRKCRKDKRLTQKELASMIGAKHTSISNWEMDQNIPDGNKIVLLVKALGVSPEVLVGDYNLNEWVEFEEIDQSNPSKLTNEQKVALEYSRAIASDVWRGHNSAKNSVSEMTKSQVDLLLFAQFMSRLEEKYPNMTEEKRNAFILEYGKYDIMDMILSHIDAKDKEAESGEDEK